MTCALERSARKVSWRPTARKARKTKTQVNEVMHAVITSVGRGFFLDVGDVQLRAGGDADDGEAQVVHHGEFRGDELREEAEDVLSGEHADRQVAADARQARALKREPRVVRREEDGGHAGHNLQEHGRRPALRLHLLRRHRSRPGQDASDHEIAPRRHPLRRRRGCRR